MKKLNMDWLAEFEVSKVYTNEEQSKRLLAYGLDPSTADKKKGKIPAWSDERLLSLIGARVTVDLHKNWVHITRKNGDVIEFHVDGLTQNVMDDLVTIIGELRDVIIITKED